MSNLLLDYLFKISAITPTPDASVGFLRKACVVVKPKNAVPTGVLTACTSQTQIAALTDNVEAQQLLNAGMSSIYILPMDDLDLAEALVGHDTDFYTILISSDFDGNNENTYATGSVTITSYANLVSAGNDTIAIGGTVFTAGSGSATPGDATFQAASSNNSTATSLAAQINAHAVAGAKVTATADGAVVNLVAKAYGSVGNYALAYVDGGTATVGATLSGATMTGGEILMDIGTFTGVVGLYSQSSVTAAAYAAVEKQVGFYGNVTNKAKNMMYAFGKMLSNALAWRNQQFITMPLNDGIVAEGVAEGLFDDRVSFVISDETYGNRLSLFATGGKAIVAPYVAREIEIRLQSAALSYISANQPAYTPREAALLQNALQDVMDIYIANGTIEAGTVVITLEQENFVASGAINIAEPKALWRIFGEMRQTL